ncbi:hypothetical protein SAMN02745671_01850 [Anaerovibrio lipolyticus DSM 3074]|uniref:Flagellar protein FliT n=1 Tax=Anaerovibrio lipolyticus DSM 3074 TaxID=1120997 RepID=A0A1M6EE52_9FIRM|nr:hypothetical protein [Anaerovibrio lipolyticus]SHI83755.1 hypothetical protein SAMN02745671_01850 [Anaerovibrio lipolyticus DSM 3074]
MDGKHQLTEQELWEKYLAVTRELMKFIDEEDIDTFLELVDQRQQLMEMLQALPDHEYARSLEGVALRKQIEPMDMQIMHKARSWLNRSKRNNMTVRGYDSFGLATGNMFNREY